MPKLSKVTETKAVQTTALDFADAAATKKFVQKTLVAYNTTSQMLHVAACASLFLSCAHARVENLGLLYDGLTKNDKLALKIWVGKLAAYEVTIDGKVEKKHWIEFDSKAASSDGRWKVKKGTEEFRKASIVSDKEQLMLQTPFNVKENVAANNPFEMVDALVFIKRAIKTLHSKCESNDVTLPANINEQLALLEKMATIAA